MICPVHNTAQHALIRPNNTFTVSKSFIEDESFTQRMTLLNAIKATKAWKLL